jgi:hypothetical protein
MLITNFHNITDYKILVDNQVKIKVYRNSFFVLVVIRYESLVILNIFFTFSGVVFDKRAAQCP